MYDDDTAELIRSAPALDGLDRQALPDFFAETYAQIAAARIRLRERGELGADEWEELIPLVARMRRLANVNEALVSILPEREDRRSAAFVAGTAHQMCFNADRLWEEMAPSTYLHSRAISSDIAALLLFLVAEATADAAQIRKSITADQEGPIERALVSAICNLATGSLEALIESGLPNPRYLSDVDPSDAAAAALYLDVLRTVHLLAEEILEGKLPPDSLAPINEFQRLCHLSIGRRETIRDGWSVAPISSFPGPHHLASLLVAVSKDLSGSAVTKVPSPLDDDEGKWAASMRQIAKSRPFLWRNHLNAIKQGYLKPGTSAAVAFPTGAGKSTLAELKILSALLVGKKVIFLAPTHALVDQTAKALTKSFPNASVQGERQDEFGFTSGGDVLPEVLVMTPESCLTQMSIDGDIFQEVGLVVFDECHLLHPSASGKDRRAIDAMLCILNLAHITESSDFLLMSAMMKNADDIAQWLEGLTQRPCIPLALSWKPTRQLRGSVVYHQEEIQKLQQFVTTARGEAVTKSPSNALKRKLNVEPLALFSMKQTWATSDRNDYALVPLLNEKVQLSANKYWKLTPNSVAVSSAISVASAEAGLKTLVFFQTIKNAAAAAEDVSSLYGEVLIDLNEEESELYSAVSYELGGEAYLYVQASGGVISNVAAVHHGLLLPEERRLCESLYKRPDGLKVLAATSTVAQGMNFPSEMVIIAEDSRFDAATDRREILQAQELLNAAGRAGRAGESSTGIVLVIPGRVVGIDLKQLTIGAHWVDLREIFGESDQCLEIDDPLTAVLDRVHVASDDTGELERYAIVRLAAAGGAEEGEESLKDIIRKSYGAFLAKKREEASWIEERVEAAVAFYKKQSPETETELVQAQIASTLGLPLKLVSRLSGDLDGGGPEDRDSIPSWYWWFFKWLEQNSDLLELVCPEEALNDLFGKSYKILQTENDKKDFALPILRRAIWRWMRGDTLSEIEKELGTDPKKLGKCLRARKLAIRIVPHFSYLFGLPSLLHERAQLDKDEPLVAPAAVTHLSRCVRLGLNSVEKIALRSITRKSNLSRRQLHDHYKVVKPHLEEAKVEESWEQTLDRVQMAVDREFVARLPD